MDNPQVSFTFHDAAPLGVDRTAGWDYFSAPGEVYERDGLWYLTSHRAVRFAHQHPEIFSSAKAFDSLGSPVPLIPIAVDQPAHIRYRRVLDPMFAPRVVNKIDDELRRQAREIIAAFAANGECDIVKDLAELYPTQVILTMFGLPLDDRDQFMEWTRLVIGASGGGAGAAATEEQMMGAVSLFGYLQDYITKKRTAPGDDVLSKVLALTGDEAWTDEEVLGMCFLFVIAGLDTVAASIGFVMLHLARNPELRRQLAANPELAAPVIEEVLRLELPAPITPRVTLSEVEVLGTKIPAGATAMLVLATANREGRSDDIDLPTADLGHLTFGGGIHRCLGSHLARRELSLVVDEFLRAIPEFTIAEGYEPRVEWPAGTLHLASLPICFPLRGYE